jgi:selenocysteine lyase/cysteine desulfurase
MSQTMNRSRRLFLGGTTTAAFGIAVASAFGGRAAAQEAPAALPLPPRRESLAASRPDEAAWTKVRSHFSLDPKLIFLNNGTLGPAPDAVVQTREYYNRLLAVDPTDNFRSKELRYVRQQLAKFIQAQPGEVAITHSTTEGMNIFAHGVDWKPGDEVIIGDQEHFGAVEPYQTLVQRYGIKIVTVQLPIPAQSTEQVVSAYAKAFTPRTRALVVSHVSYVTGLVAPLRELAELAHAHGALISVDGAQSFGVLSLDTVATGIDHFAGAGQKWLLAGTGTGVNYVRREVQNKLWPLYGYDDPAFHVAPRYERSGQLGIPAALGIASALQFQSDIGQKNIETRARELGRQVREGAAKIPGARLLSSSDPALSANINVFTLPNIPAPQAANLLGKQENIVIRGLVHGDVKALRISTHFYNTPEQVDRLLGILARWSKDPPVFPAEQKRPA